MRLSVSINVPDFLWEYLMFFKEFDLAIVSVYEVVDDRLWKANFSKYLVVIDWNHFTAHNNKWFNSWLTKSNSFSILTITSLSNT